MLNSPPVGTADSKASTEINSTERLGQSLPMVKRTIQQTLKAPLREYSGYSLCVLRKEWNAVSDQ